MIVDVEYNIKYSLVFRKNAFKTLDKHIPESTFYKYKLNLIFYLLIKFQDSWHITRINISNGKYF